MDTRLFL
ncbi:uncharacterized protein FTOL_13662 [Fusarium torulosum]|nr:uncharacterized protein FTOL_13662 [Fusarium torulosum]